MDQSNAQIQQPNTRLISLQMAVAACQYTGESTPEDVILEARRYEMFLNYRDPTLDGHTGKRSDGAVYTQDEMDAVIEFMTGVTSDDPVEEYFSGGAPNSNVIVLDDERWKHD